jgi:drug/metabolite transporter (DMT)-like permease
MHHSQLHVVLLAIMMLSLLWGSSFIAIKIIVDEVQPLASFGMRFFIAGILLPITSSFILLIVDQIRKTTRVIRLIIDNSGKAGYYQPYSLLWGDREYSRSVLSTYLQELQL